MKLVRAQVYHLCPAGSRKTGVDASQGYRMTLSCLASAAENDDQSRRQQVSRELLRYGTGRLFLSRELR